jgi:D-alanyl-D-alanine carboxypeptidase
MPDKNFKPFNKNFKLFSKNIKPFHTTIMLARDEAMATGSRTVEAEHILLALSRQVGTDAQEILESAGLDHAAILDAIEREFEQSLSAVGVSPGVSDLAPRTIKADLKPRFGQSAKMALARACDLVPKRVSPPLEPIHLLLGVLYAKAGTVPRILAISGVDVDELTGKAESALSELRKTA